MSQKNNSVNFFERPAILGNRSVRPCVRPSHFIFYVKGKADNRHDMNYKSNARAHKYKILDH